MIALLVLALIAAANAGCGSSTAFFPNPGQPCRCDGGGSNVCTTSPGTGTVNELTNPGTACSATLTLSCAGQALATENACILLGCQGIPDGGGNFRCLPLGTPACMVADATCCDSFGGSAGGDPHFVGPWGADFNFDGVVDTNYNLFSAPDFQMNMWLTPAYTGPFKYIGKLAIMTGGQTLIVDTDVVNYNIYNQLLKKAGGGRAYGSNDYVVIELCGGEKIEIAKRWTWFKWRIYHLNVKVSMPGCHKDLGGVLGQTFNCKHNGNHETFVWDKSTESSFKIDALTTIPHDSIYDPRDKCRPDIYSASPAGPLTGHGGKKRKAAPQEKATTVDNGPKPSEAKKATLKAQKK